jgi:hypothetical protein
MGFGSGLDPDDPVIADPDLDRWPGQPPVGPGVVLTSRGLQAALGGCPDQTARSDHFSIPLNGLVVAEKGRAFFNFFFQNLQK